MEEEVVESGCCVLLHPDTASGFGRREELHPSCPVRQAVLVRKRNCEQQHNRWCDKSVQLVVDPNGKAGLMGEHSMMDGMPVVGLANHIVHTSYEQAREESESTTAKSMETFGAVSDIFGNISITPKIAEMIETSKQNFEEWTTGKHELEVQTFRGYGSDFMKKAGFSPDAYAQMAMQVATSRLFGKQAGTYEATQTRVFRHGRTETTRTVSPASAKFVKSLLEPSDLVASDKIALLNGACQTHAKYIGNAAKGMGVDRHFLGMSLLAKESEVLPDLYSDPVFARSKRWRVSTSNLTHPKLENWGYGEVVPDGVGLSYSVHKNHLVFGITALKEHGAWPEVLSNYLEDALVEMKLLVEESVNSTEKPTRSKL